MGLNVSDMRAALTGGGSKPNLFLVDIVFPKDINLQDDPFPGGFDTTKLNKACQFLVKSAQIPSSDIGIIKVPFRGRELPIPGDRTFEPMNFTLVNSGDMYVRAAFEAWSRGINAFTENTSKMKYSDCTNGGSSFLTNMTISQLSRDGIQATKTPQNPQKPGVNNETVTRRYRLYDCWCSSVSGIALDYSANDQISESNIVVQYSYFEVLPLNAA